MKQNRDQIKAELLAEAEAMVDELLDWQESLPEVTATQLEEKVQKIRDQLDERWRQALLKHYGAARPAGKATRFRKVAPDDTAARDRREEVVEDTVSEIRRVMKEVEPELLKLPGVTGVDVGYKVVAGKKTDVLAIRVYVAEKKDVSEEEAVPRQIGGAPTDVIEREFVLH
jgi:hypothetical protein